MQPQPSGLPFHQTPQGMVDETSNYYQHQLSFHPGSAQSANPPPGDFFYNEGDGDSLNSIRQQPPQLYHHPYQQQSQQVQAPPPKAGSATPYFSRPVSCASPKAFRPTPDRNSFQSSPSLFASGTQSPKPPHAQPFVQMPTSTRVPLMNPPAPVFQDYALQQQQQQPHLQDTTWHQRTSSTGVPPPTPPPTSFSPPPPSFLGNMLKMFVPRNMINTFNSEMGGDSSQDPIPLHQQRFGHPEDDLPLLVELGIHPREIRANALAVLNPFRHATANLSDNVDLAGPIVFVVLLALLLSLRGNLRFSFIYGQFVLGVIFMRILLSLMTDNAVSLQFVISALGYGLIPNVFLAASQSTVYWLFGYVGKTMLIPSLLAVAWSAWCATSTLVKGFYMEKQRYLIMYPLSLFYAVFAALIIF